MGKKKNSQSGSGCLVLIVLGILFYFFSKQWWGLFFIFLITTLILAIYSSLQSRKSKEVEFQAEGEIHKRRFLSSGEATPTYKWMGKGTKIKVGNYLIHDPMTYFSKGKPFTRADILISFGDSGVTYNRTEVEASCIYSSLPVGTPVDQGRNAIGYWPCYSNLTPDQRANYLEWLESGRQQNLTDIGYAFIYFYGLERRLLIENQDWDFIVEEVVSLLNRYTSSGSFSGYLGSFLAYVIAKAGIEKFDEQQFKFFLEDSPISETEEGLAVSMAWMYKKGLPLPLHWAMRVAKYDPRSPRSVVVDRVPEKFLKLFKIKYQQRCGEGLILKVSKRDREISYHPASPSLPRSSHGYAAQSPIAPVRVPNALGIQNQFKPLVQIWKECVDELKSLSQKIKSGVEVDSREAYEALPDALKKKIEHPDQQLWEQVVSENMREDGIVLLKVSRLARIQAIPERPKLTMKQSINITETASYIGYAIEPDPRVTGRTYSWEDTISLFYPQGEIMISNDPRYVGASIILELGICVAAADGMIDDAEVDHITHFLEGQFMLDSIGIKRLETLKHVLIAQPPSLNGVGKRLQSSLNENQLEKVGKFLVGVASADGVIDKNEISVLKRAYKALGIGAEKLDELLNTIRRDLTEPVEVRTSRKFKRAGEAIPYPSKFEEVEQLELDEGHIRDILQNTKEVADILEQVFERESDDPEQATKYPSEEVATIEPEFEGLDTRYKPLLKELAKREEWDKKSFEDLVRRHGLMPSGTIDIINEWADEYLGDLLIEEGELILVNLLLLRERRNE